MSGDENILREAKRIAGEGDDPPPGYLRACEAVERGALAYAKAHPFAEYSFRLVEYEREMAARAGQTLGPGERCAIAAPLSACIDAMAGNEDARGILRAMDQESGGEATYMMARAVIDMQIEAMYRRASGQLPEGDWRCIACEKVIDGFTNIHGETSTPKPGACTVCAYCGALQKIADDGRYAELPAAELRAAPKSVRMHMLEVRNNVLARLKKEAARS